MNIHKSQTFTSFTSLSSPTSSGKSNSLDNYLPVVDNISSSLEEIGLGKLDYFLRELIISEEPQEDVRIIRCSLEATGEKTDKTAKRRWLSSAQKPSGFRKGFLK